MRINGTPAQAYRPCYQLNPFDNKWEIGSYNYADLMRQLQKQAAAAKSDPIMGGQPHPIGGPSQNYSPEVGQNKLSEEDIRVLAQTYNPEKMTQKEYDAFIRFLQEKGVLSEPETYDLGMSICKIIPGYFEPLYISGTLFGDDMHVQTLSDVGGDAIRYAEIMVQWHAPGDVQLRQNAYYKVLDVLNDMKAVRAAGR